MTIFRVGQQEEGERLEGQAKQIAETTGTSQMTIVDCEKSREDPWATEWSAVFLGSKARERQ